MNIPVNQPNPLSVEEEDAWDTDDFVIPSFGVDMGLNQEDLPESTDDKSPKVRNEDEKIYLGPNGTPLQAKQDSSAPNRKKRFKQKLKEADRKHSNNVGHENKLEHIQELVGSKPSNNSMLPKTSNRDWLDPHCHESEFDKSSC